MRSNKTVNQISEMRPVVVKWPKKLKSFAKMPQTELRRLRFVESILPLMRDAIASRNKVGMKHVQLISYKRVVFADLKRNKIVAVRDPIVTIACVGGTLHIYVGVEDDDTGQSRLTHDISTNIPCGGSDDGGNSDPLRSVSNITADFVL